MAVTSFLLLKRSDANRLAERAVAAVDRWSADWHTRLERRVEILAANDYVVAAESEWRRYDLANGARVWLDVSAELQRNLERSLFGLGELDAVSDPHLSSGIAASVICDALDELSLLLMEKISEQRAQPAGRESIPPRLFKQGSGAVVCIVDLGASTPMRIVLSPDAVPRSTTCTASPTPVISLQRAMARVPVKLSVEIGRSELTLGYLKNLAVGDVLALPARVDHPLRVLGPAGDTVCHAHLGIVTGHRAVDLVATRSTSQPTTDS